MLGLVFYLTFGQAEIQDWAKERTLTRLWGCRVADFNVELTVPASKFLLPAVFSCSWPETAVLSSCLSVKFSREPLKYTGAWALVLRWSPYAAHCQGLQEVPHCRQSWQLPDKLKKSIPIAFALPCLETTRWINLCVKIITNKYLHGGGYGHEEDLLRFIAICYRAQNRTEF